MIRHIQRPVNLTHFSSFAAEEEAKPLTEEEKAAEAVIADAMANAMVLDKEAVRTPFRNPPTPPNPQTQQVSCALCLTPNAKPKRFSLPCETVRILAFGTWHVVHTSAICNSIMTDPFHFPSHQEKKE
jgi:hypothetical protein